MNKERISGPRQNVKFALFALSGNQCAFPDCDASMFEEGTIVGEICHIHAQQPGGPRYKNGLIGKELHSIENLVLLCQKHHKIVDENPVQYDAARLKEIKEDHESRAAITPNQVLHRLIEVLTPEVPDNWWERPSAPVFHLNLASSRPPDRSWVFEVGLEQVDGGDIGNLHYRYRLGEIEHELKKPTLLKSRKWQLGNLDFRPRGEPFELELKFWWAGAERSVTYRWETEAAFQDNPGSVRYS